MGGEGGYPWGPTLPPTCTGERTVCVSEGGAPLGFTLQSCPHAPAQLYEAGLSGE